MTILSHLLKGESIIEKYYKDKENEMQVNVTSSKANTSSNLQNISEPLASSTSIVITRPSNSFPLGEFDPQAPNLDILVDMGFSRETAGDALARNSYDVEQAAEFLLQLSMPRPVVSKFLYLLTMHYQRLDWYLMYISIIINLVTNCAIQCLF